jgi:hypothetical protein
MTPEDRELLDRVRLLHSTLTHRTVLLTRCQSNVDVFTEGMRDLGQDFHDLGTEILHRVTELAALPFPTKQRPIPRAHLAELALSQTMRED